jgi:signal transduction histidine kinase
MTTPREVRRRPAWQRYAGAILLTSAVVAGRLTLDPWWGYHHNRHLVFLPTVMIVAWFGGFWAGVVSTALSTAALYKFWSDVPGVALHLPSTDLVLFAIISVAISRLVDSLQVARARADFATRSRERVLEVVAHDLRSPLAAIKTTCEGMARVSPEFGHRVDRVKRAVGRMEDLIRDLVDTTHIEHGKLAVSLHPEPIAPIVQETVDLFATLSHERKVTLEIEGPAPCATVPCDRGRIIQVLSNLIGNALKFTHEGGRITVAAEEEVESIRLVVRDTGDGIRPENLPHVFEQYWKTTNHGGTGLGLFIARSIVQAHGGRIWAESTPGAGAVFSFTLPRGSARA